MSCTGRAELHIVNPKLVIIMNNELIVPQVKAQTFDEPDTFFTLHNAGISNPRSAGVMKQLANLEGVAYKSIVCGSPEEARRIAGPKSVAIFDGDTGNRRFNTAVATSSIIPDWAAGTAWCVKIGEKCHKKNHHAGCARQTRAHFGKRFLLEIGKGNFPWGTPKKGTDGPREIIEIDRDTIAKKIAALNSGPDLAAAIADRSFALELPRGSKISWVRVLPEPVGFERNTIQSVVTAMRNFEKASHLLLQDEKIQKVILRGVTLQEPRLREVYLNPGVDCFTVTRPDLHWHPSGLSASENDEMPGGMPELVLLDDAYGMNEDRWKNFFDWLTREGPLLFLVSHQWSKCYVPETAWLVSNLITKGYDVRILMTDQLHELSIESNGVYHNGSRLGAIWRQFPIFETGGKLADLVFTAREGKVGMYPEWGHFGNKAWFHLFWKYQDLFAEHISPAEMSLLQQVLPESRLVEDTRSLPFIIGQNQISNITELLTLPEEIRDGLVMKIVGANSLSARSYGVLMGRGIKSKDWSEWISSRLQASEPFLVQKMFDTGVAAIPAWHTGKARAEMFRCRLLMRPWVLNGEIVSVHGCAVPRECFKVHGMVSMAVTPIRLM